MPASKNLHNSAFSCPRFPPNEAFGRRPRAQSRAPAKGRPPKPFSIADVAARGAGRLNWAESGPTEVASGRTGVRAKAGVPLRARNRLQHPKRGSIAFGEFLQGWVTTLEMS